MKKQYYYIILVLILSFFITGKSFCRAGSDKKATRKKISKFVDEQAKEAAGSLASMFAEALESAVTRTDFLKNLLRLFPDIGLNDLLVEDSGLTDEELDDLEDFDPLDFEEDPYAEDDFYEQSVEGVYEEPLEEGVDQEVPEEVLDQEFNDPQIEAELLDEGDLDLGDDFSLEDE